MGKKRILYFYVAIFTSVLLIVVPILFYVIHFRNKPISNDSADWSQLSDFLGVFVNMASLLLISVLTYTLNQFNSEREAENERVTEQRAEKDREYAHIQENERIKFEKGRNKPVLIFKEGRGGQGSAYWFIKNVGSGPALNVLISVAFKLKEKEEWVPPVALFSLMTGEEIELEWIYERYTVGASYTDLFNDSFTSILQNSMTTIYENRRICDEYKASQYTPFDRARIDFPAYLSNPSLINK